MDGHRTRDGGTLVAGAVTAMAVVLLWVLGEVMAKVVAAVMNLDGEDEVPVADGSQSSIGKCLQAATLLNQASKAPTAFCSSGNNSLLNKERQRRRGPFASGANAMVMLTRFAR